MPRYYAPGGQHPSNVARFHAQTILYVQYSDKKLYNQILYFDHLFDLEHAQNKAAGTAQQGESFYSFIEET